MLRVLVVLLLAANALFFAWTQGWLDSVVGPARPEREPQRLAAQVRPELVQILPPVGASAASNAASSAAREALGSTSDAAPGLAASAGVSVGASAATAALPAVPVVTKPSAPAASAPAAPSAVPPVSPAASAPPGAAVVSTAAAPTATTRGTAASPAAPSPALNPAASAPATTTAVASAASVPNICLEAGPYTPAEVNVAEAALKPLLASGDWVQRKAISGGEWMIYMGPYPEREAMDRKKAELARIRGGVPQEEVSTPPELARGLSLGRFPSPTAANATLAQYRLRGIRTARVVQSSSGAPVAYLRVAQADAAMAAQLSALKPPPAGRAFSACPR